MLTLTRVWGRFLDWTTVVTALISALVSAGTIAALFKGLVDRQRAKADVDVKQNKASIERLETEHRLARENRADQVTVLNDVLDELRTEIEGLKKRVESKDTTIGRLRDGLTAAKVDLKEATMLAQSCAAELKAGREAHERCERELTELRVRVGELESKVG